MKNSFPVIIISLIVITILLYLCKRYQEDSYDTGTEECDNDCGCQSGPSNMYVWLFGTKVSNIDTSGGGKR